MAFGGQLAAADHDQVVGGQRHFAHQVAGLGGLVMSRLAALRIHPPTG